MGNAIRNMSSDLTFITNENDQTLEKRFSSLIKDTRYFDCLVGYFYASGFHSLYQSLESTEKIRILIGISTSPKTYQLIQESKQVEINSSSKEVKDHFSSQIINEMNESVDSWSVEEGISKFIEWLRSGKLEIKVYPSQKIHAKVYIMTFIEGHIDSGRVITGSSNFTQSGLRDNIEFNVELKNRSDYEFSLTKFNELWEDSIDVSEDYIETINKKTWLNDEITPYELFLKFLYEYFKEKINLDKDELVIKYLPPDYMELDYQKDAVRSAKQILEEYGGVFISDVVGLGKTFVSAMLAQQLDGRHLVIAPPSLIDRNNPGSWPNVFGDFGVRQTDFESIGSLDNLLRRGVDKYTNIFIDEAHRFRTESTQMYENLFEICRGKRVILVSATPLNNSPLDILSQIKLFQNARKSTLPNPKVKNLEQYFIGLQNRLKGLDRQKDKQIYLDIIRENAKDIRENVLRHLMIRRTRSSIVKYYQKDMEKQNLVFPTILDPAPIVYHFDKKLNVIFNETLDLIINEFKYARYIPLLYLKKDLTHPVKLSQQNMMKFLKILLLKRLESSFYAFKQSIRRFIISYLKFIEHYEKGQVFVSKKYTNKIFDLLEENDTDTIDELIDEGKAQIFTSSDFREEFIFDLKHDLSLLKRIESLWNTIDYDPKLDQFISLLTKNETLVNKKTLVFTESKETAQYLERELNTLFGSSIIAFSSDSPKNVRIQIIENFDANVSVLNRRDDLRVLISTDILSEGVSLHRANVVINYDIPWNPVRMMQRVGRVNRVSKHQLFDNIYIFNFFPAGPIDKNISLQAAAESKITAFIEMLGNDAKLLTDEEIKSHELFSKLNSKSTIIGEEDEDPELKYLTLLRDLRDNRTDFFDKIKKLPRKCRSAKVSELTQNAVLTFFRKGKLRKIYRSENKGARAIELGRSCLS